MGLAPILASSLSALLADPSAIRVLLSSLPLFHPSNAGFLFPLHSRLCFSLSLSLSFRKFHQVSISTATPRLPLAGFIISLPAHFDPSLEASLFPFICLYCLFPLSIFLTSLFHSTSYCLSHCPH